MSSRSLRDKPRIDWAATMKACYKPQQTLPQPKTKSRPKAETKQVETTATSTDSLVYNDPVSKPSQKRTAKEIQNPTKTKKIRQLRYEAPGREVAPTIQTDTHTRAGTAPAASSRGVN